MFILNKYGKCDKRFYGNMGKVFGGNSNKYKNNI